MVILNTVRDMHIFEHFTGFLSSIMVVITFFSMVYPKTRKVIMEYFKDKSNVKSINELKKDVSHKLAVTTDRVQTIQYATVTLLHDRLYDGCTKAIHRGYTTVYELDNIRHLYDAYHSLGGNGTGTDLIKRVLSLPLQKIQEDSKETKK